jgi:hypothetical protein
VRLDTRKPIDWLYFQCGTERVKAVKHGNYFIAFNTEPGTNVLSYGMTGLERHYFTKSMIDDCTVTISGNEMMFIGDFSASDISESVPNALLLDVMGERPDNATPDRVNLIYGEPVRRECATALKEFAAEEGKLFATKGWDVNQFRLK